jgi:hypothetical protein
MPLNTAGLIAAAGDSNPVNRSTCSQHGPYSGLICPKCVTSLPSQAGRPA